MLGKCAISDRHAVHLIIATAQALHHDVNTLIVNRSSIRRCRESLRVKRANEIKEVFQGAELKRSVAHFDGKMLENLSSHEKLESLPIVITDGELEQLLEIPELQDGKGITQASIIYEVLQDWGLTEKIKAICCDTTASNLGHANGAAVQLERLLERELLYLPCRHHIYELLLRAVFDRKMPASSGPNVVLFQRFQDAWKNLNKQNYKIGLEMKR